MLFFGHIGITTGVVRACDILASKTKGNLCQQSSVIASVSAKITEYCSLCSLMVRIKERIGLIDYRLVLFGSLLPDIIDKPVWLLASRFTSAIIFSGRGYAHTLLFSLVLLIVGMFLIIKYRKSWLLVISLSGFIHLILDESWRNVSILLWPLLGSLPGGKSTDWLSKLIRELFSEPSVYVPEIIGLIILLWISYRLVVHKKVMGFLRTGMI